MNRTAGWITGAGIVAALGAWLVSGRAVPEAVAEAPAKAPAEAGAPAAPQGKVVYTFDDAGKLEEFTTLWQQRQSILLRMAAIQSYWTQDQAGIEQLNKKITATYNIDPAKNYFLDRERRVLLEREGQAPSAPAAPAAPEPTAAPNP